MFSLPEAESTSGLFFFLKITLASTIEADSCQIMYVRRNWKYIDGELQPQRQTFASSFIRRDPQCSAATRGRKRSQLTFQYWETIPWVVSPTLVGRLAESLRKPATAVPHFSFVVTSLLVAMRPSGDPNLYHPSPVQSGLGYFPTPYLTITGLSQNCLPFSPNLPWVKCLSDSFNHL